MPGAGFGMTYSKPTDVMGRRVGAYVIDLAVGFVILIVMVLALASTREFQTSAEATAYCDRFNDNPDIICTASGSTALVLDSSELGAIVLAEAGFVVVNFVLLTGLTGFSFGKLLTGVRVVNQASGQRCGIPRALLRTVLLFIPDLGGVVGFIVAASSTDHRRVGDMAASTLVVHKRALGHPPTQPVYAPSVYAPGGYAMTPQVPAGYGYPAPPATPWSNVPPAPTPPPGPRPAATTSWPEFAPAPDPTPTADPDATMVFDTTSKTDEHPIFGPPPTAAAPKAESRSEPQPEPQPAPKTESKPESKTDADFPQTPPAKGSPGVGAPHWDVKRNTYIQWDPELNAWMQWDLAKNEWHAMK